MQEQAITHLLTGQELDKQALTKLLTLAQQQKAHPAAYSQQLAGANIATIFEKPSLRTRMSLEVGINKLGGHAIYIDEQGKGLGGRESVADYAKNLSCWCDAIVARVLSHDTLVQLAEHASVPVINSLCDQFHPCQALADCLTLQEQFGEVTGLTVVYAGDGNNVTRSLMLYAALLGANVIAVTPEGQSVDASWIEFVNSVAEGQVSQQCNFDGLGSVDVIYTDTWVSMGDDTPLDKVKELFLPYQVNAHLVAHLKPKAVMHCQPIYRGYEVTAEVIDSDLSLCLQQAENRMYAQNALLTLLLPSSADSQPSQQLRSAS